MLKLFSRTHANPATQLTEIFEGYELPTFPAIYLEALQLVRDEGAPTEKLSDLLAADPGLTVRLLHTVNSAAFGLRNRITSVHHAVSMLGRSHIESMLISLASHSALPSDPCDGFEPARFWKTAAQRGATAKALADCVNPAVRSECFTAGLLQDMAIPLLSARKGTPYSQLLDRWHSGDGELQVMERETFGWDHAQVATMICNEWSFPESIAEAIALHHGTDDPEIHQLPPVNLASLIPEVDQESAVEQLIEQAHSTLGLDRDQVRELIDDSFRHAEEIANQFV